MTLPNFLQWIPMLARQPNPEGKGEITLYNLMINALRQRPDIVLVGEIKDAEGRRDAVRGHTHRPRGVRHRPRRQRQGHGNKDDKPAAERAEGQHERPGRR